jgi:GxxExxY protein
MTKQLLNELTYKVLGAAIEVHKALGPGLLESVYHKCLIEEFKSRGYRYQSEFLVPVQYKGLQLDAELRCDFVVNNLLVVELKAVEALAPIHEAQLLTYMKLLQLPKGVLINFNSVNLFKEGQKTMVNELYRNLPDE